MNRSVWSCLFALCSMVTVVSAADWPQWRGPERTGLSTDVGLLKDWNAKPPKLLWTAEGLGSGYASVAVVGGRTYTTGNLAEAQAVICIDDSGKVAWSRKVTDVLPSHQRDGARSTPSIDGDRLYAIASSGKIVCLKIADGSEVWSRDFKDWNGRMMSGWGFSESPLVDGNLVLCTPGASDATIVALDKLTGKEIWRTKSPPSRGSSGKDGAGYSSIVVSNACGVKQYVQLVGRGLIGVRADNGEFLWQYNRIANGTANIPTSIVEGDFIFCSSGYRDGGAALLKLVKEDAGIRADEVYYHPANVLQNHHGQMVLKDGYVYFGNKHNSGFPVCVELATGKIAWGGSERGPGSGSAAVTYADGHVVFRFQSGEVSLIEATPSAYRLKGTFTPAYVGRNPCWAQPVVVNGKLYLRDQDKLLCYDVRE